MLMLFDWGPLYVVEEDVGDVCSLGAFGCS